MYIICIYPSRQPWQLENILILVVHNSTTFLPNLTVNKHLKELVGFISLNFVQYI